MAQNKPVYDENGKISHYLVFNDEGELVATTTPDGQIISAPRKQKKSLSTEVSDKAKIWIAVLGVIAAIVSVFSCQFVFDFTRLFSSSGEEAKTIETTITPLPSTSISVSLTQIPVLPTSIVVSPIDSANVVHTCSLVPIETLIMGDSGQKVEKVKDVGTLRIYSHCPLSNTIRYIEVIVDDQLNKVELICPDGNIEDITAKFHRFYPEGERLPHYESDPVVIAEDCWVNFTVKDTAGENIHIMITGIPAS